MTTQTQKLADEPIKPRFWRDGNKWRCARPVPSIFPGFPKDWWKRSGLRGIGDTKKEALADLESWERCARFVAEIY